MAEIARPNCTHVIFDNDGLLLDTERIYTDITQKICQEYGKTFDISLKQRIMGNSKHVSTKVVINEMQLPITVDEFLSKAGALNLTLFPTAKLLPGVEKLVRHLHKHNIPIAVATGSATREFDLKITHHKELFNLFHHTVKSDDPAVKHGKPNPDIFQVAASRFTPPPASPDQVLVFEDAPNGVQAGKAAGMNVVMVPEAYVSRTLCSAADQVLNSLEEFNPADWGLPSY
ncbi:predicted protein [Nematostella vectensis]|uniref:pseudouridine 5'-phosphatase n=1 Tax=Nematostella vectensis TaxID=45351 RepID=A7SM45_NEMVE|nr:pseudouridine-5'-phosphatase [Nematostella vectensis]EDO35203.1 predicted protein [Nematostella vectensis]|eukprot:XP_001627303.1 predicted protein [Nematostella vectensis]